MSERRTKPRGAAAGAHGTTERPNAGSVALGRKQMTDEDFRASLREGVLAHSRQELFHLIKIEQLKDFRSVLEKHGKGRGCDVCKPAVASMLASLWDEHVLDDDLAPLQDTNDLDGRSFMAQVRFQPGNLSAHRPLSDVQQFGCAREVATLGGDQEGVQRWQRRKSFH